MIDEHFKVQGDRVRGRKGNRRKGWTNKECKGCWDATQKVKGVIWLCLYLVRPTMHAFRPRSQQAGALHHKRPPDWPQACYSWYSVSYLCHSVATGGRGLKKKEKNTANKKEVNTFHKYTRQTTPHASRIRGAGVSSLPSGELGKSDFKTANQNMKMKEGESRVTAK